MIKFLRRAKTEPGEILLKKGLPGKSMNIAKGHTIFVHKDEKGITAYKDGEILYSGDYKSKMSFSQWLKLYKKTHNPNK